jgi:protein-tyrosine phosphatase
LAACCQKRFGAQGEMNSVKVREVRTVLFLCTGNYYRSRFAEELFNHRAHRAGLGWIVQSRGLLSSAERTILGRFPCSRSKVSKTAAWSLWPPSVGRGNVISLTWKLPQRSSLYMSLSIGPVIRERLSAWENRVEYWQVADVEMVQPRIALSVLDRQIECLLTRLL